MWDFSRWVLVSCNFAVDYKKKSTVVRLETDERAIQSRSSLFDTHHPSAARSRGAKVFDSRAGTYVLLQLFEGSIAVLLVALFLPLLGRSQLTSYSNSLAFCGLAASLEASKQFQYRPFDCKKDNAGKNGCKIHRLSARSSPARTVLLAVSVCRRFDSFCTDGVATKLCEATRMGNITTASFSSSSSNGNGDAAQRSNND